MFNSQVDLRSPTPESLAELVKNAIPQPDGTAKLVGPVVLPGDRVTWKSSRYGWVEGAVHEARIRRGRAKYEKKDCEWIKTYPKELQEQLVVVGEYKYSSGRVNLTTIVIHPSRVIKVTKGQSAQ